MQKRKKERTTLSDCHSLVREQRLERQADQRLEHRVPLGFITRAILCNELLRKEAQRFQLQDIGEPEGHFLDADCLQLGQMVADRLWTADQRACGNRAAQKRGGDFRSGLLIGFSDGAQAPDGALNTFVVAPDSFTVIFDYSKLPLDGLQIAVDIACISILRYQFERHFFAPASNQQGDMRFLDAFRLVDSAAYLVVGAFKDRFFL